MIYNTHNNRSLGFWKKCLLVAYMFVAFIGTTFGTAATCLELLLLSSFVSTLMMCIVSGLLVVASIYALYPYLEGGTTRKTHMIKIVIPLIILAFIAGIVLFVLNLTYMSYYLLLVLSSLEVAFVSVFIVTYNFQIAVFKKNGMGQNDYVKEYVNNIDSDNTPKFLRKIKGFYTVYIIAECISICLLFYLFYTTFTFLQQLPIWVFCVSIFIYFIIDILSAWFVEVAESRNHLAEDIGINLESNAIKEGDILNAMMRKIASKVGKNNMRIIYVFLITTQKVALTLAPIAPLCIAYSPILFIVVAVCLWICVAAASNAFEGKVLADNINAGSKNKKVGEDDFAHYKGLALYILYLHIAKVWLYRCCLVLESLTHGFGDAYSVFVIFAILNIGAPVIQWGLFSFVAIVVILFMLCSEAKEAESRKGGLNDEYKALEVYKGSYEANKSLTVSSVNNVSLKNYCVRN